MTTAVLAELQRRTGETLRAKRSFIIDTVVEREFARHPELVERYGAAGRDKAIQDAHFHLSFLAEALALNDPTLFVDYTAWAKVVLVKRDVRAEDLAFHLQCLAEVIEEFLPTELGVLAAACVASAVQAMPGMPDDVPDEPDEDAPLSGLARQYFEAIRGGDRSTASTLVLAEVAGGTSIREIYLHVFQPAQYELGRLWQTNRITVAQEHYCTAATQLVMSQLYEHVFRSTKNGHRMVATSVADNLHEIGVRMVADFFEMDGWDSYYLGASVPHAAVLATVADRNAEVLAISAALAPQVEEVRQLITAVRARPDISGITILVGGLAFNRDVNLWRHVGADAFAADAQRGIDLAVRAVSLGAA